MQRGFKAVLVTKIKEYRENAGMKQAELAELVKARRETIVHLENGKYNPSLKLAMDIAKVFGVSVEELLSLRSPKNEESIYNIIHDRDYTNAKANAKKYVYFCVCFGIIYTDRNDPGGLQHEGKSIFRI